MRAPVAWIASAVAPGAALLTPPLTATYPEGHLSVNAEIELGRTLTVRTTVRASTDRVLCEVAEEATTSAAPIVSANTSLPIQ